MVHFEQKINFTLNIIRSITIQSPNKSSVLIYDNYNSEVIKKYVLADLNYSILYTRREKIFLSPNIIFRMVKRIFTGTLFGGSFVSKLYRAYLISYIEYIDPKVVITIVDNDILYYVISNYFPDIKFYAIQNGTRLPEHIYNHKKVLLKYRNNNSNDKYNVILICFGYKEKSFFANYDFNLKYIIPAGSLKESIFADIFQKSAEIIEKFDICLISQYSTKLQNYPELLNGLNRINYFIKKLIDDKGYKLCIALRSEDNSEIEFFKDFFGDSVCFIAQSTEFFSTYSAMDSSKLIVSYHSTCGFEAIGQGKKVLFCIQNSLKSDLFGNLEMPHLFVSNEDYQKFKDTAIDLINMDYYEYVQKIQKAKRYLMNNNEDVPLYIYLRDSIQKSIML